MQRVPVVHTDALPSLCSSRKCLNDPVPGKEHCQGCIDKAARKKLTTLYVIGCEDGMVTIGMAKNVKFKLGQINAFNQRPLTLLAWRQGMPGDLVEILQACSEFKVRDRWYDRRAIGVVNGWGIEQKTMKIPPPQPGFEFLVPETARLFVKELPAGSRLIGLRMDEKGDQWVDYEVPRNAGDNQ